MSQGANLGAEVSDFGSTQTKRCSETPRQRLPEMSVVFNRFCSFPLNWRHFILVLWWRGERFSAYFRCRLGRLDVFRVHLFRLNPADLDGEEFAVILSSSAVGRSSSRGCRRPGDRSLRVLGLKLHPVHLDQVFVGWQLGDAGTQGALRGGVLAAAHCLFIGGDCITLGLFLSTADEQKQSWC